MPDDLKARVAAAADSAGRSLHAELLMRISESFRQNQADADAIGCQMQLAEKRVVETRLMVELVHLANCTEVLLQMLRGPDPKGALKAFEDIVEIADRDARAAKKYIPKINPRLRLQEYEKAVERAEQLIDFWNPNMLPWPGSDVDDDPGGVPKSRRRTRNPKPKPKP